MGEAKRKKQRECPAKGGVITPEECGRGRLSAIACPADCPHQPFAPERCRELLVPLEERLDMYLEQRLSRELSPAQLRELADVYEKRDYFTFHAMQVWHLHSGERPRRWVEEGLTRLWKNDEQVLLGYIAQERAALVEVREIVDATSYLAVDLLQPGQPLVRVVDPDGASSLGRYQVMLIWAYPLPGAVRSRGGRVGLPMVRGMDAVETLERILSHLGAPTEGRETWMLEHMPLLAETCEVIEFCSRPDGPRNPDLIPPGLETRQHPMIELLPEGTQVGDEAEILRENFSSLADRPMSALEGKTPRQAAADPAMAQALRWWARSCVGLSDLFRRTSGMDYDANDLLRELGLDDLVLPAPPIGRMQIDLPETSAQFDPVPVQKMLTREEVHRRIDHEVTASDAAWNRLQIRLADVLDAFNDLPEKLNAGELSVLRSATLIALGALHPQQVNGYDPDPERMLAWHDHWAGVVAEEELSEELLDDLFAETRQPELCELSCELMMAMTPPGGGKVRRKKIPTLIIALTAAIWEAAHWPPA